MNYSKRLFWTGTPIGFRSGEYVLRLSTSSGLADVAGINSSNFSKRLGVTRAERVCNKRVFVAPSYCMDGTAGLYVGALPDISTVPPVESYPRLKAMLSAEWVGVSIGSQPVRVLSAEGYRGFVNSAFLINGVAKSYDSCVRVAGGTDAAVQDAINANFYHSDMIGIHVQNTPDTLPPDQFLTKMSLCDQQGAGFYAGRSYGVAGSIQANGAISLGGITHFRYQTAGWVMSYAATYENGPGTRSMPLLTRIHPDVQALAARLGVTPDSGNAILPMPYVRNARSLAGSVVHGWHDALRSIVIRADNGELDACTFTLTCAQAAVILRAQKQFVAPDVAAQLEVSAAQLAALTAQRLQIVLLPTLPPSTDVYQSQAIKKAFSDGASQADIDAYVTGGKSCATWRAEIKDSGWNSRILTWITDSAPHDYGSLQYVSYNTVTKAWSSTQDLASVKDGQILTTRAEFKIMANGAGMTVEEAHARFEADTGFSLTFGEDIAQSELDLRRESEGAWTDPGMCLWKAYANKAWQGVGKAIVAGILEPAAWFES